MSQEDLQKLISGDRELLLQIILENDAAVSNVSPGIMILEALKYAVEKQEISVKKLEEITEENSRDYLIYDENFLCITSEKLWECCRKYADYRKTFFPYKNGRELLTPLKEENLILLKREGRSVRASHKITADGKIINQRFLYLYRNKVEEKLEALEEY
jgi:hypothetical protein